VKDRLGSVMRGQPKRAMRSMLKLGAASAAPGTVGWKKPITPMRRMRRRTCAPHCVPAGHSQAAASLKSTITVRQRPSAGMHCRRCWNQRWYSSVTHK